MADHSWKGTIPNATRERILRGRVPVLIHDERPPFRPGDRVILEWGRSSDPELGVNLTYPSRWIKVVKVSADGARWITQYDPPPPRPSFLRRGAGYTSDPFLALDRVEAEHFEPGPEDRAKNTLIQERRRMEAELERHLVRWARGSEATKTRLDPVIESCRYKLAQLQERSDS
jgi:hypothetical protein